MSDPVKFLTSLGQALATMLLYSTGHPARERGLDAAFEQLQALTLEDPFAKFSFLDGEVIYGNQVLRDLKGWDWGARLAKVQIQRVEFTGAVSREELARFLADVVDQLGSAAIDTADARQLGRSSIRFGTIGVRGAETETVAQALATVTIAYSLGDEAETVRWMHEQVATTSVLPLLEAEAVVRSLSIAMHGDSQIILPLLQLKTFDQYTTTHSTNVAVLAMALAEFMGLGAREVRAFGVAGLLHDLGKVRIPKEVLLKPGQFTQQERDIMRQHPVEGARIILEREKRLDLAAVVAYEHHIMLNGGGYPSFHFQRDCHYASRLVHVCDVYDALCTNRPYRDAWRAEVALAYLEERSAVEFDGDVTTAFCSMMRQWSYQRVVIPQSEGTIEGLGDLGL